MQPEIPLEDSKEDVRYVFFVRHAESRWNAAQAEYSMMGMFSESDHGLSETGRKQAEELNQKATEARRLIDAAGKATSKSWELTWQDRYVNPNAVLSSPYSRAIETALIGMQDILSKPHKLIVTQDAREMRSSVLAVDCSSSGAGDRIKELVSQDLCWIYEQAGDTEKAQALIAKLDEQLDLTDVQEDWCPALAESVVDLDERHAALLKRIQSFENGSSVVLVGHSYYFKRFFTEYLGQSVDAMAPDVGASLKEHVVPQCAVIGMKMIFKENGPPLIAEVAPLLGTKLKPPSLESSSTLPFGCTSRKLSCSSCGRRQEGLPEDSSLPAPEFRDETKTE